MRISNITVITMLFVTPLLSYAQNGKGDKGEATFQQCAGCHGPDGRAQTDMGKQLHAADLTSDAVQRQSDSQLSKTIKSGKGKMPAFDGKLSDDEIRAVVGHVKDLGKK
jgi:mono/diheme cytochrome c family protein